jgi:hypothetical protein
MNSNYLLYLSGLISENDMQESQDVELKNYMFFSNLRVIKEKVDALLAMDAKKLDEMIENGHDWASEHVATAKDDMEEVYNWASTSSENRS